MNLIEKKRSYEFIYTKMPVENILRLLENDLKAARGRHKSYSDSTTSLHNT